jgi:hypothetical protein
MSKKLLLFSILLLSAAAGLLVYYYHRRGSARTLQVIEWIRDPASHPELIMEAGTRCGDAPFVFPTAGMAGFIWDDSFRPGHRHQGIDIFAGAEAGRTPVIAAYPGYLTREEDWKASVIVRVPDDPLQPGRQIWVYYTHMADSSGASFISGDFPPGTRELYVETGTLLGYQGNYSGDAGNPVGVHLHFSIVEDDGFGNFRNELEIENTLDPSPYLGLPLNANENTDTIPACR